jgi:3-hydroxybutyryl-CoA dehydratase
VLNSEKYIVGKIANLSRTFRSEDVSSFAKLSGDTNPLHLDAKYAATTRFKRRIIHGPFVASIFGTIFGTIFPGEGAVYISQTLRFIRPVFIGDTVTASVELTAVQKQKSRGIFRTICTNQNEDVIIEGEAQLLLP